MSILNSLTSFVASLTFVDFVFFFAVIVLLILIISLVYFIKINEDVLNKDLEKPKSETEIINEAIKENIAKEQVHFTNFEKEQEDKAIISYDELVKSSKNYDLNYIEEKNVDGLSIKKINLEDMYHETNLLKEEDKITIRVISYKKEEEFLQTLKSLQTLLS